MASWSETKSYSMFHDCEMARISVFDERHMEFWKMIPTGRGYRDRRAIALEEIMEAIESGADFGEVK